MTLSGQLVNSDSRVLAGGTITTAPAPQNQQTSGAEVLSRNGDSIYCYLEHRGGLNDGTVWSAIESAYALNTVNLAADNAIRLEANQNIWEQHGSNKSSGTSIGVGYAAGAQNGFTIELGVSQGQEGGNITGEGVKIRGDNGVLVQAGGVLDLHEARDVRSQSREVSVKKSGFGIGAIGPPLPDKKASRDTTSTYSNTATVTIIESTNGGMPLQGDQRVALQGVQVMRPRT